MGKRIEEGATVIEANELTQEQDLPKPLMSFIDIISNKFDQDLQGDILTVKPVADYTVTFTDTTGQVLPARLIGITFYREVMIIETADVNQDIGP